MRLKFLSVETFWSFIQLRPLGYIGWCKNQGFDEQTIKYGFHGRE